MSGTKIRNTTADNKESVSMNDCFTGVNMPGYKNKTVKFIDAKWNFLNQNGDSLFSTPFEFAQNFYKKTAVVKGKDGWGVVNSNKIIIPLKYSSIERIPLFMDTLFKVQITQKGAIYLDTNLSNLSYTGMKFDKGNGINSVFSSKDNYRLIGTKGNVLMDNITNIKLKKFNYMIVKENKQFSIYDVFGRKIGESKICPTDFIDKEHFTYEDKGRKGVIGLNSDTIIPIDYDEINLIGTKILAVGKKNSRLYSANYELIKEIVTGKFLVDSITGTWAISNPSTMVMYNAENKKIGKWKTTEKFSHYYANYFFSEKGGIYSLKGKQIKTIVKFDEVIFYPEHFFSLQDQSKKWHLYSLDLREISDPQLENRKFEYHGDQVFSVHNKGGFTVYDLKNDQQYQDFTSIRGDFTSEFIVAEKSNKYFFVDRNFTDTFKRRYQQVVEFKNNFACVSDGKGWTIIGKDGYTKKMPSYPEIKQVGYQLFETSKKPLYGIIDSNGKTIIDPIFEKLTILNYGVIQAIKEGEIYYFDFSGNNLYPSKNIASSSQSLK